MKNIFFALTGAVLLTLCSCFSRIARVEHFGKSLTAEYGQANDGSEYVDIRGDMKHNSALIMPNIKFSAEQDTIHIEVELTLVKKRKSSLDFPWRIPLSKGINRITFGPKDEIIWQRELK